MSHRRSTVKGSLSFANPTVRAWLFQILAVVAVVGIIGCVRFCFGLLYRSGETFG